MKKASSKTPSKRNLQLAEEIRRVVATMFASGEIRDPRLQGITIHHVKLSPDLQIAKVYYIIAKDFNKDAVQKALNSVSSKVRRALGTDLFLRYTPEVHFYYDDNIDHSIKIHELISKL